jgi:hypothetical protein
MGNSFDVEQLLIDVFAPQRGERVLVMTDVPHGELADSEEWAERREMALEWHEAFRALGKRIKFSVYPLVRYPASGAHNAPLPEKGEMDGKAVRLEQILADTNIVVAMTQYSPTAPLINVCEKVPTLRGASMPGVTRGMERTALAADYSRVAERCAVLAAKLDPAVGARVDFSTGHRLFFDLRDREPDADDGQVHPGREGIRIINLPSGETCIAPYEGEVQDRPSRTDGSIPAMYGDELVVFSVRENRIVDVIGDGPEAAHMKAYLAIDDARRNIAELGLGCNDKAVICGEVLEDEKVMGMHWAYGRSDHLGGSVGVDSFSDPIHVVHEDTVYAKGGPIEISSLVLEYEDGTTEEIIRDSVYTVF